MFALRLFVTTGLFAAMTLAALQYQANAQSDPGPSVHRPADSDQLLDVRSATGKPGSSAASRVGLDEQDFLDRVYAVVPVPKLRIGWYVNERTRPINVAREVRRPLVMVFHRANCPACRRLLEYFRCPSLAKYASQAVFAIAMAHDVDAAGKPLDPAAREMLQYYKVSRTPAVIVIDPRDLDRLDLRGKLEAPSSMAALTSWLDPLIRNEGVYLPGSWSRQYGAGNGFRLDIPDHCQPS